ncbi:MAG: TraR/DksA C4-type zinc finger protein [Bacteroidia bacterium]|nr:TraR/DksA C4-type zinc finger protein [Bacteroidia bacterium]
MNKEERANFKDLILKKIERTSKKIEELEELVKPYAPENSIGRVSRMDAINNQSVMKAALRADVKRLSGLRLALANLDNPGFGKCLECQNAIAPKRLLLMPESKYCVRCAR